MNITEEILQVAHEIHKNRIKYIGREVEKDEINDVDIRVKFDAWMFLKLAELQVRIKQLEDRSI